MEIQIVLFDGFDLLDAIAPYEVFTAAAMYTDEELMVKLVSAEGERLVTSGVNHVQLQATDKLNINKKGIIVIPGASGSVHDHGLDSIPVKLKKAAESELGMLLKNVLEKPDILLSTVCGGSLILAMTDLLEGRHAVTHHMGMELLNASDAIAVKARIVDDGDLITAGGVTSGLDLALYLVERELGPQIAHAVEQLFEYERRGTVWKAEGKTPIELHNDPIIEATHPPISTKDNTDFLGKWDTTITTPIGKLSVMFEIDMINGQLVGNGKHGSDTVPLDHLILEEHQLKWSMKVTKPMRLTLKFCVSIDSNRMTGEAKAGMLPPSKLTGVRIS